MPFQFALLVPAPPAAAFQRSSSPEFPPPYGLINMPEDFGDNNNRAFNVCLWIRSNLRFRLEGDPTNTTEEIASRASTLLEEADTSAFRPSLGIALTAVFCKTTGPERGFRFHESRPGQPLNSASARHMRDVIFQCQPVLGLNTSPDSLRYG
ncbi:hypothetical protein BV898_11545 [Hypsibius exemplaris]|uniref:Uncharacterized protein n=1 Tax=Hypsibius exemplaris TaxID=2072580 RepID=A0A1W0WGI5_HYPEX|nr:hypothetical protein BV898_11545 [Hypsibius exemplaris]